MSHIILIPFPRISGKAYSRVVLMDVMMKSNLHMYWGVASTKQMAMAAELTSEETKKVTTARKTPQHHSLHTNKTAITSLKSLVFIATYVLIK